MLARRSLCQGAGAPRLPGACLDRPAARPAPLRPRRAPLREGRTGGHSSRPKMPRALATAAIPRPGGERLAPLLGHRLKGPRTREGCPEHPNGLSQSRPAALRVKRGEGSKDEIPIQGPRMGYGQPGGGHALITKEHQIQVDGAWRIRNRARPTMHLLQRQQGIEQRLRG